MHSLSISRSFFHAELLSVFSFFSILAKPNKQRSGLQRSTHLLHHLFIISAPSSLASLIISFLFSPHALMQRPLFFHSCNLNQGKLRHIDKCGADRIQAQCTVECPKQLRF